jgi:WD40 repeat protein
LAEPTGDLQVFTTAGAQVHVDGKPAGVADENGQLIVGKLQACRDHKIAASRAGYDTEEVTMRVSAEVMSTATLDLRAVPSVSGLAANPTPKYEAFRKLTGPLGVEPIAVVQPDSKRGIAWTRSAQKVMLWDPATGRQLKTVEVGDSRVLTVTQDLKLLAVTPEKGVLQILDLDSGREVKRFRAGKEPLGDFDNIQFSHDARRILVVGVDTAGVWDINTARQLFALKDPSIGYVRFTPDGRNLVSGNNAIAIWNAETGALVRRLTDKADVRKLVVSPHGRWLGLQNRDQAKDQWQLQIWRLDTGELVRTIIGDEADQVSALAFTPDSNYLVTAQEPPGELHVLDIRSGLRVAGWPTKTNGAVWSMAISADGQYLVTCTSFGDFVIWRQAR